MSTRRLKILGVHGVGNHPRGGQWESNWKKAIAESLASLDAGIEAEIDFVYYDDIFAKGKITVWQALEAVGKLVGSALTAPRPRARGIGANLRWTAGMVVQWVADEELRKKSRARLSEKMQSMKPDVVCAHSLGSLVSYDTFTEPETRHLAKNRTFASFGSQIGNPFVVGNFLGGRIEALGQARHWFHLYNRHDDIFTAPIQLSAPNFTQVNTEFDLPGFGDHAAGQYLSHPRTVENIWTGFAAEATQPNILAPALDQPPPGARWTRPATQRAFLVGINQYPDPQMRLEGCVNDVFLVSEMLQERGLETENIRVLLDDRATAKEILHRLNWLLDDVRKNDTRIFYFSGHGAKMPGYGLGEVVDRHDETLVPHDFDWSPERAVTDDQFFALYSQIPYDVNFLTMFDCCHSGGMTRDGVARIRGINPPDDVRHRALLWDRGKGMWLSRAGADRRRGYTPLKGARGSHRMGCSVPVRTLPKDDYDQVRKLRGHKGPYMPLLLYACREDEYAYEYRHGTSAYGAFTYSLVRAIRGRGEREIKFNELMEDVTKVLLDDLEYDQHPVLEGPKDRQDKDKLVPGKSRADDKKTPVRGQRVKRVRKRR